MRGLTSAILTRYGMPCTESAHHASVRIIQTFAKARPDASFLRSSSTAGQDPFRPLEIDRGGGETAPCDRVMDG